LNEVAEVEAGGDGDAEEADHHFVPGLVAEADFGFGIGVKGVVGGVVE